MKKGLSLLLALCICAAGTAGCMDNSDGKEGDDSRTGTSSSELAMSFDEAVKLHYEGMYERDISKWKDIVPQGFWDTYPDINNLMNGYFEDIDPNEMLPGGMGSLEYEVEDLTEDFKSSDSDEAAGLKRNMARWGVEKLDGVWHVDADLNGYEGDTLIVKSGNRYYSTYALGGLIEAMLYDKYNLDDDTMDEETYDECIEEYWDEIDEHTEGLFY